MAHQPGLSFRFTHAITRTPANSVANGLRAVDAGDPSGEKFREEHGHYVKALQEAGLVVDVLPALETYPDSCFVEDPAFCLPEGAIQLRPGTKSRLGEGREIRPALEARFGKVTELPGTGHVDGGDVLMLDDIILIGLSARTDREGAESFKKLLGDWGYTAAVCETPTGVLHFKTACSTLGDGVILATGIMAESGFFGDRKIVTVPKGEEYAANVIRVNDVVLVPEGYPGTLAAIEAAGFKSVVLPTHEARKVDGGLSCLSLRFSLGGSPA
ncbi:MAG: dimethylarginine dimethylaminohydrolase [Roseibium sp.]|uniref:dimethylarginine dimethylaminohydrolase family protein n=1 Tax=Roseibium sp. TaxID=1936156 RepID=UPI001B23EDEF|nr:dimethylarginine dimethylaminohydrolase [Roseibium sp.]MBO6894747.1 dimethylarginine dimethylaminohydrolase [Roseibium sp.]MBO6933112.1 dimethylarginine dimethylaminohydrolase [Roseibium sp.]